MSNVVLAGLVKTAVAELVNEQKPFNLALVLSRIPAQSTTVVDLDFVETQMNKLFYAEEMADFEISIVDTVFQFRLHKFRNAPSGRS